MQRLDILPGPNQPSGCVPETITQSKPVSTPKKSCQAVPFAAKSPRAAKRFPWPNWTRRRAGPRLWRTTSLISWPVPTHDRFRSLNGGR